MNESPFKQAAQVRRLTGRSIRVGVMESIAAVQITDEKIVVLVNRASTRETRYGLQVTRRGNTAYEFNKINGMWRMAEPLTVWYDLDEPELHTTWPGKTPEQHAEQRAWEDECYRPGTPDFPMDNAARRAQGIK